MVPKRRWSTPRLPLVPREKPVSNSCQLLGTTALDRVVIPLGTITIESCGFRSKTVGVSRTLERDLKYFLGDEVSEGSSLCRRPRLLISSDCLVKFGFMTVSSFILIRRRAPPIDRGGGCATKSSGSFLGYLILLVIRIEGLDCGKDAGTFSSSSSSSLQRRLLGDMLCDIV